MRRKKSDNPRISVGVIAKAEPFNIEASLDPKVANMARESDAFEKKDAKKEVKFLGDMDEIGPIGFYHINYHIREFKDLSPDPIDWYVSRFYPASKVGAVFVDRPESPRQIEVCKKKATVMAKLGHKYYVYRSDADQSFESFREQTER